MIHFLEQRSDLIGTFGGSRYDWVAVKIAKERVIITCLLVEFFTKKSQNIRN